jgi:hypothetical protein
MDGFRGVHADQTHRAVLPRHGHVYRVSVHHPRDLSAQNVPVSREKKVKNPKQQGPGQREDFFCRKPERQPFSSPFSPSRSHIDFLAFLIIDFLFFIAEFKNSKTPPEDFRQKLA